MNRAEEDYIKSIYELSINQDSKTIKTSDISERLGFTDQSVNEMIKRLEKKGFLTYTPYKGVELTNDGNIEAIRLIRAHRVWEVFLSKHLAFNWKEVHNEAELLEHAGSKELIDRLYDFIGRPKHCGHGNPIPDNNGKITSIYNKSLYQYDKGDTFSLKRVLDQKDLLHHLDEINISIGDEFIIIEKDTFNKLIKIKKDKNVLVISNKVAKMLFGN